MQRIAYLLAASAVAIAAPAHAQQTPAEMQAELEELRSRVQALETLVQRLTQAPVEASPTATRADGMAAAAPDAPGDPAAPAATVPASAEQPTVAAAPPESEDRWSVQPFGRIQYDFAFVSDPANLNDPGLGFSNELRRGRIGVQGDIPGGFGYKLEVDFADNDVALTDAILSYETEHVAFAVGQHNSFQGLEELTSSRFITFMERAAFTDAFGFERRVGASIGYAAGDLLVNAGVFTDDIDALTSDETNGYSFDGRAVFSPEIGSAQLHFGASAHWRDLRDTPGTRYRQRPFVHSTDTRFMDTGTLPTAEETSFGLEAAVIAGRFHGAAEGHWLTADLPVGPDPTFFGGYVEAGVFLTPDSRGYSGGRFNRTRPANPVGEGGIGAIQFNVRYDYLDLNDAGIVGGVQNLIGASLIWTPIDHARFVLNYGRGEYDEAFGVIGQDFGVDIFGVRTEVDF